MLQLEHMNRPVSRATSHLLRRRAYPQRISLVFPIYNEEAAIPFLRGALEEFKRTVLGELEVVLVNDGSTDETLALAADWAAEAPWVKVIHLSRNFGHQIAATAGLDFATGDAVVLLDADLQDPLGVVHEMIDRYCEGYDVVYGQRRSRAGETKIKLVTAWLFYRLMRAFVYEDLPLDSGDFRLISREFLDALCQMRETHRFLRGMVAWAGYPSIAVPYERAPRIAGQTKYPMRKMLAFAWTAATSFSAIPLRASVLFGVTASLLGVEEGARALLAFLFHWYVVPGWTSLMVVTCVIGGAILICLGILGEYVGKLYEQSKGRPLYLVSRAFNVDNSVKELVENSVMSRTTPTFGNDSTRTFV